MLNVRIRQRWLRGGLTVGTIGAPVRLTYDHQNLGLTPASLLELAAGKVRMCTCVLGDVAVALASFLFQDRSLVFLCLCCLALFPRWSYVICLPAVVSGERGS